jgi:hypothetical protein
MRVTEHRNLLLYAIPLALGLLTQAASLTRAEDVYPPSWNVRNQPVGPVLYDFKPGCWGDTNRYWPEQETCRGGMPRSRPMSYGPVVYQFNPGGSHYQRVRADGQLDARLQEDR